VAEDFLACLLRAELPASLTELGPGQAAVGWLDGRVIWVNPGGLAGANISGGDLTEDEESFLSAAASSDERSLMVNGVDRSIEYRECLESTGYTDPEPAAVDPADEARDLQEIADISNNWSACAREHGFRVLKDADPPSLGDSSIPAVKMPATMSVDELRTLLESCPYFDRQDAEKVAAEWAAGKDSERRPAPSIEFDEVPGSADAVPVEHYDELYAALREDQNAFLATH